MGNFSGILAREPNPGSGTGFTQTDGVYRHAYFPNDASVGAELAEGSGRRNAKKCGDCAILYAVNPTKLVKAMTVRAALRFV